jgi:Domain of unknown function (DUF4082)/Bacterial Ig-like domain
VKKSSDGTAVAGSAAYVDTTRTITFTPTASLAAGTSYTATVSGAKSSSGTQMTAVSWSFTTAGAAACPCTLFASSATPTLVDSGDASSVELGVKFVPQVGGRVSGVRFYKSAANTGTHVGNLWSSTGTKLATVTFSGESASGWQSATFSAPVAVTAGTTYVVSYLAPNGHYSANSGFFATAWTNGPLTAPATTNGVYRYGATSGFPTGTYSSSNYWVDVVFSPTTGAEPVVSSVAPGSGASGVAVTVHPSATFAAAIQTGTAALAVKKSSDGTAVAGSAAYVDTTRTVTFTPTASLAAGTSYTATVSGAKAVTGELMTPFSWSFTTAGAAACPCSLFASSVTPAEVDSGDSGSVELGMKFVPQVAGSVTGIRFYKSAANTGTHVGNLWSSTGTKLATVTFSGESASGWQSATFSTPVAVTAGTTYVVSYFAPAGRYSDNASFFTTAVTNGPLTAPAGTNDVYRYGATSGFPSDTFQSANYWVDVVFTTS